MTWWSTQSSKPEEMDDSRCNGVSCYGLHPETPWYRITKNVIFTYLDRDGRRLVFEGCSRCNARFLDRECDLATQVERGDRYLSPVAESLEYLWTDDEASYNYFRKVNKERQSDAEEIYERTMGEPADLQYY